MAHIRRKMVTMKAADAEDIRSRAQRGRQIATIKKADAEDI